MEHLPLAIGIGLVVSLLLSESFGITAGGMVVPGYVALQLNHPVALLLTLGAGLATYVLVRVFSSAGIIYGRRRVVLMILVGYLMGMLFRHFFEVWTGGHVEYHIVGFIIPGLIAIWLDRQGILETYSALIVSSVVVRLVMILALGKEMAP
ncbi:MAG TPA: poly-gamma-glutamate biosynthesis protein PgsC [Thermodesulfobacteriota bacterium]|nr:poly-gamma-glutamate biosynthesis protein PgsC [Thermodesulfobacteriota bacterium]